jgi:hypothetical protein
MRRGTGPGGDAGDLRVLVGLARFGLVALRTLTDLVRESAGRPDPIELEPRILQHRGPRGDDGP